jgi:hypothetical protein
MLVLKCLLLSAVADVWHEWSLRLQPESGPSKEPTPVPIEDQDHSQRKVGDDQADDDEGSPQEKQAAAGNTPAADIAEAADAGAPGTAVSEQTAELPAAAGSEQPDVETSDVLGDAQAAEVVAPCQPRVAAAEPEPEPEVAVEAEQTAAPAAARLAPEAAAPMEEVLDFEEDADHQEQLQVRKVSRGCHRTDLPRSAEGSYQWGFS